MLAWLAPILVFGLVVLVHEVGHFVAAKLVGVYAPRFSIGFGRPLWRRRYGETEYVLGMLPLGGYVRMASREDEATAFLEGGSEERGDVPVVGANDTPAIVTEGVEARRPKDWDPNAMMPFGPRPVPEHRWFESKPLWARLFIMIAGVTMNIVLALAVSTGIFAVKGRPFTVPVVDSVVTGGAAAAAGMQRGDTIVVVGSRPVARWDEFVQEVSGAAGTPLNVKVKRGVDTVALTVTPQAVVDRDPTTGEERRVGRIGVAVSRDATRFEPIGVGSAFAEGWGATWGMAGWVVDVLKGLLTGRVSVANLGGPIEIARTSVAAARSGVETLFYLIALLSVNVAIFNLLPIPILDGGQILLNIAESIKGSAFSARTREYIARAGLVAIAALFVLVMFNDLKKIFS